MDYVLNKNDGEPIPLYNDFSQRVTVGGFLGFASFLLKGDRTFTMQEIFNHMEQKNHGYHFDTDDLSIEETQYIAEGAGMVSLQPNELANVYYLEEGGNPLNDNHWHPFDFAIYSGHEKGHVAANLLGVPKEKEEEYVI
ncbi:MAG: hypothetical protein D3925_02920, partial [Candidatus Electrothrix sp. AR5]|nr:hypothetical protein [Candidatus Electrothrix sp. AR5]